MQLCKLSISERYDLSWAIGKSCHATLFAIKINIGAESDSRLGIFVAIDSYIGN